jgi:hypothetical protein
LSDPTHQIVFHFTPKHCSSVESDWNLVQYLSTEATQASQFYQSSWFESAYAWIHCLFQPYDGKAIPVDI